MRQEKPKPRYLSYLLRLWENTDGEEHLWRASLECPRTGARQGFTTIEALFDFLRQETAAEAGEIRNER
ncbi:MAG: hypothetical protein JW892_16295 [Anaerolineae bacterium]|nr:hypothetical protein [Anaerolineae bacterium]